MSALFSSPKIPTPAQSGKPPGITDPIVQNDPNYAATARGYGSTILTSGQGVTTPPTVAKKQLLGG